MCCESFRAQRQKEGSPSRAALWTSGHKTRLICLQFSMRFHSWWGRERLRALSFVWNLKMGFFSASLIVPFMLQLGCRPFHLKLPRKACWSHSTCCCRWYFKVRGGPYPPQSLSVSPVTEKHGPFSKWIPSVSGDEPVMWWDFPHSFSTLDKALHPSFLSVEWVAIK